MALGEVEAKLDKEVGLRLGRRRCLAQSQWLNVVRPLLNRTLYISICTIQILHRLGMSLCTQIPPFPLQAS